MELLERFARGDLDAFEMLFRQFQNEVYGRIARIVRDPAVAEDLTVETFWRIYRAHARFDPSRSFGAWAHRVATNVALDHLRNLGPEVAVVECRLDSSPRPSPDPAIQQEIREGIARAFGQLLPKLRVAATLALVEEEPYEDIAEALGVPVGTVKSRVFRAIRLLRKKLKRLDTKAYERTKRRTPVRACQTDVCADGRSRSEAGSLARDAAKTGWPSYASAMV